MTEPLMLPDYVTYGVFDSREIVGIVKIKTKQFITLYDFSKIKNPADKKELLSFAAIWWSQSNRTIPISIFIKNDIEKFEAFTTRIDTDAFELLHGPLVAISDIPRKRIKRRNVALKPNQKK